MDIKITVLFDNYVNPQLSGTGLKAMWGFAAFVEYGTYKILFDSGSNGRVLKHNAVKLGINLKDAQYFFLSHPHWDHIGGWDTVVEENPAVHFVWPSSVSTHLIEDIKKLTRITVIGEAPHRIEQNIFSTGILQPEGEQALVLNTDKGLVIIAGCSHPRIENFILRAKQMFPAKPVYFVLGGFHLLHDSREQIIESIKKFDTELISPTHCTGQLATALIREQFKENYIQAGVGKTIVL